MIGVNKDCLRFLYQCYKELHVTEDEMEMERKLREQRRALYGRMEMLLGQYRATLERRVERALLTCKDRIDKESILEGLLEVAEEELKEAKKRYSAASLLTDDMNVTRDTMDDYYKARERVRVLDRVITQLGAEVANDPPPERGRTIPFKGHKE